MHLTWLNGPDSLASWVSERRERGPVQLPELADGSRFGNPTLYAEVNRRWLYMNARSVRVLTDRTVKAYFTA